MARKRRFYNAYKSVRDEFEYGVDYVDIVSDNRYLVLIPFNLRLLHKLYYRALYSCRNCLTHLSDDLTESAVCAKNYFLLPYCTRGNVVKVFVFDLHKFELDPQIGEPLRQARYDIAQTNQESFFTFWLDRDTNEPLDDGYCYLGGYFNIAKRHKECNYKERKKNIINHREFFYDIKENFIDPIKNDVWKITNNISKDEILGKLKTPFTFYEVWSIEEQCLTVIPSGFYDNRNYIVKRTFKKF